MNITEIISAIPEETLIAGVAFIGTGGFYVMRLVSTLKNKLTDFENQDLSGRESLERDLGTMNDLVHSLRSEYQNVKDDVEEELVEHELDSLAITPRFRKLGNVISDGLDEQSDSLIDLDRALNSITVTMKNISASSNSNELEKLNEMIPTINGILADLKNGFGVQQISLDEITRDINLIKSAYGQ